MDPINIALSGLNAASQRIAVSANNVVNSQSTTTVRNGQAVSEPFIPKTVEQTPLEAGGVSTSLRDVAPPTIPLFLPEDPAASAEGIVQFPNVNLETEVANQLLAANTYKANLAVIKKANETYESLLDITG